MLESTKKSVSLVIALLIVMATIAVPVATAETSNEISVGTSDTGCGTCGAQNTNGSGCGDGINKTITELSGSEKNKAIAEALKNEKVKELRAKLLEEGYIPETNAAKAAIIGIENSTSIKEIIGVRLPFKSNASSEGREIVFAYDPTTGDSAAIIANSVWDCATCALGIAGCALCAYPCAAGPNPLCIGCLLTACPTAVVSCCACIGCPWPCPSGICA